MSVYIVHTKT